MSKHQFLFLVFTMCLVSLSNAGCLASKYEKVIHVINRTPDNIVVHCKSRDNNLGFHTLVPGQDYNFQFCVNIFETNFDCTVEWGNKKRGFDAYTNTWFLNGYPCGGRECIYEAKTDAIYRDGKEKYPWEPKN